MYPLRTYNLFFMAQIDNVLQKLETIDAKCDGILVLLNKVLCSENDQLLERLRQSADDMYRSSIIERERNGIPTISVVRR